ncbi:MAG: hypothetical protein CMF41_00265, partial [Legionellales bacterium]
YMRENYQDIHRYVVSKLSSAQKIASGNVLNLPVVSVEELIADLSETDFFRVLLNPFHSQKPDFDKRVDQKVVKRLQEFNDQTVQEEIQKILDGDKKTCYETIECRLLNDDENRFDSLGSIWPRTRGMLRSKLNYLQLMSLELDHSHFINHWDQLSYSQKQSIFNSQEISHENVNAYQLFQNDLNYMISLRVFITAGIAASVFIASAMYLPIASEAMLLGSSLLLASFVIMMMHALLIRPLMDDRIKVNQFLSFTKPTQSTLGC